MYSSESTANKGNPMSGHFSADQDSSRLVPRVVLAKPGLDGHNIGLRAVARKLRDEGVEVIYAGMMVTIDQVVSVALGEDVDVGADLHPDGDRFIAVRGSGGSGFGDVYVVTDWFEELKARMGEGG